MLASLALNADKSNSTGHTVLTRLSKITLTVFTLNSLYQAYEHVRYEKVVKSILEHKLTFLSLLKSVQQRHDSALESYLHNLLQHPLKKQTALTKHYLWRDVKFFCLNPEYAGHPTQVRLLDLLLQYYQQTQHYRIDRNNYRM